MDFSFQSPTHEVKMVNKRNDKERINKTKYDDGRNDWKKRNM